MKKKIVLAYSGGLDTSVILKWLMVEKNYDVIAVCVDVGQSEKYPDIWEKAIKIGAKKVYIVDAKEEFVEDYVFKGVKAGAVYEDEYLLGTAYARPLIAKILVEIAVKEGAVAISHGATGKGNDQVRFEAGIIALAPHLKIVAPWRTWNLQSREDCIEYAINHDIPISVTKENIYSRDENIWHISHEGGDLEDPWVSHTKSVYKWCKSRDEAPDVAEVLELEFNKGVPTHVNGELLAPIKIVELLNSIGSKHGVGVIDIVENRLVGMKSRGVYETPGGTIIQTAHRSIEKLVLDRDMMRFKKVVSTKYADLVYDGMWFSSLKNSLDMFIDSTQENVAGKVVISLFKGNISVIASQSPFSLYNEEYVTFGKDDVYNQQDAEGFINLFTLPLKISHKFKKDQINYDDKLESNIFIYDLNDLKCIEENK